MLSRTRHGLGPVAIAIPVRDEAVRIGACLTALFEQVGAQADHIVLLINNTIDDTAEIARGLTVPAGTMLHVLERALPPHHSNPGHARCLAMEAAAGLVGRDGVLLTTDADSRADPDWLAGNLAALRAGADAVAGWVDLEPAEWSAIPMRLHEDDARECAYDALCDEIHARLDPDPNDPLPRHTQHSGASIAVTVAMFRAAGGMPAVPSGEDRALLAALRRTDARIRHSLACHVVVSGRMDGRAAGGMAETILRRMTKADENLDSRLEPAADCARRATLRRRLRRCREGAEPFGDLPERFGLAAATIEAALALPKFGEIWNALELASPVLRRRLVRVADLPAEMAAAGAILNELREWTVEGRVTVPMLSATG